MSEIYSVDQDMREAEAMVKGFERYLKGRELYGSVSGGFFGFGQMPSLTTGALVMRLRRLNILKNQLTNDQWERVNAANQKYVDIRDEWRAHFDKKVRWEVDSRLNSIGQYFKDADGSIDQSATYKPEQLKRTIVEDLHGVMAELNLTSEELDAKTRYVDGRLRGLTVEITDFLWDSVLEPAYPQKDYWWLYRRPRTPRR